MPFGAQRKIALEQCGVERTDGLEPETQLGEPGDRIINLDVVSKPDVHEWISFRRGEVDLQRGVQALVAGLVQVDELLQSASQRGGSVGRQHRRPEENERAAEHENTAVTHTCALLKQ
jgi:hypothetical protein